MNFLRNKWSSGIRSYKFIAAKSIRQTISDVLLSQMTLENREKAEKMIAEHKRLSTKPRTHLKKKRKLSESSSDTQEASSPKKTRGPAPTEEKEKKLTFN